MSEENDLPEKIVGLLKEVGKPLRPIEIKSMLLKHGAELGKQPYSAVYHVLTSRKDLFKKCGVGPWQLRGEEVKK